MCCGKSHKHKYRPNVNFDIFAWQERIYHFMYRSSMDTQHTSNINQTYQTTSNQTPLNCDTNTTIQHQLQTINQNGNSIGLLPQNTPTCSRQLSSRRVTRQKNVLSINERCMQLVSKALIKERQLRHDIETSAHDQSSNQQHIYSMQLKVQECQNIIGTATQLIRMIGDAFRETAHNIR